jgi:hypothetical protein
LRNIGRHSQSEEHQVNRVEKKGFCRMSSGPSVPFNFRPDPRFRGGRWTQTAENENKTLVPGRQTILNQEKTPSTFDLT